MKSLYFFSPHFLFLPASPYLLYIFSIFFSTFSHGLNSCDQNEFHIEAFDQCHPLLNCHNLAQIKPIKLLATGVVKRIYLVEWRQTLLVMSKLTNSEQFAEDFNSNRENLLTFRGHRFISEILGYCRENVIFTRFYANGNALQNFHRLQKESGFLSRFEYCIQYVQILQFLHHNRRLMCDSNSLAKTLTQYLIDDDGNLILNDLDALPEFDVNNRTRCGHKMPIGDLVAPEQLSSSEYDHKVDIWKIPEVCHWFVDNRTPGSLLAENLLQFVHSKCKNINPDQRPNAQDVISMYRLIVSLS